MQPAAPISLSACVSASRVLVSGPTMCLVSLSVEQLSQPVGSCLRPVEEYAFFDPRGVLLQLAAALVALELQFSHSMPSASWRPFLLFRSIHITIAGPLALACPERRDRSSFFT